MFLGTRDTQGRNQGVSLRDFEDWRAATRTFAGMSFLFNGAFNVGNEGLTPDQIPGAYVSPNLFKMLGVSPALGRDFTPAEETPGTPIVVLISNTVWRQRYGSDPNIVGKPIRIIDQGGTIIGVMPEGMHFPFNANIWLPTGAMPPAITGQPRQARGYFAVGRLNDGVTVEQARAELKTIGSNVGCAVSGDQQGPLAARGSLRRTHSRPADLVALLGADGSRRVRAADRVLERRQPPPGQGSWTIE